MKKLKCYFLFILLGSLTALYAQSKIVVNKEEIAKMEELAYFIAGDYLQKGSLHFTPIDKDKALLYAFSDDLLYFYFEKKTDKITKDKKWLLVNLKRLLVGGGDIPIDVVKYIYGDTFILGVSSTVVGMNQHPRMTEFYCFEKQRLNFIGRVRQNFVSCGALETGALYCADSSFSFRRGKGNKPILCCKITIDKVFQGEGGLNSSKYFKTVKKYYELNGDEEVNIVVDGVF